MVTRPTSGGRVIQQSAMLQEMSVDSLFQHIVLSQQQAQERRRVIQEVKSETSTCHEKIVEVNEKIQEAKAALENKVFLLLEKGFQKDLLRKRHNGLERLKDELLKEARDLQFQLQEMKKERALEEERFTSDILAYVNNYGLTSNREELIQEQAKAESLSLDVEADALSNEIQSLKSENVHLHSLHLQRSALQRELCDLQETVKGWDAEIAEASSTTKRLEAERLAVSQKPQSDAECLRLRKELESHKEEDLESVCEALRAEILFLQQKVPQTSTPRKALSQEDTGHLLVLPS
ncbi:coiled-coil domain-containing protein 172 [Pseudophryne corroboree]|uniref:coiled-coil domain-containing protein 172 n=1 Tax=Pseudophryne corroboree TaxID=495146 RepID=UPI003081394C